MKAGHRFDIAIIGGGIVGTATALALSETPGLRIVVLESEDRLAAHQTGHNSGVIHSGLYYRPGSLKAHNCREGRAALISFCQENNVPFEICGKIVVATREDEIPNLNLLEERGRANGLSDMRRISSAEISQMEPHIRGIDGLHVPCTGIIDYRKVIAAFARVIESRGHSILLNSRVRAIRKHDDGVVLQLKNERVFAKQIINCAGLQCDRVARLAGVDPSLLIVPFRGEYYDLKPEVSNRIVNLVYPVPDPRFPFLGVHFTRMPGGGVEAGPNAVLATKREGYRRTDFSLKDVLSYLTYIGFWKLSARYTKIGAAEFWRSFSKGAFTRELRRLMPDLLPEHLTSGGSGVRAQALLSDGRLCDDFVIRSSPEGIHVLNAPSPAATASIAIGRSVARTALANL